MDPHCDREAGRTPYRRCIAFLIYSRSRSPCSRPRVWPLVLQVGFGRVTSQRPENPSAGTSRGQPEPMRASLPATTRDALLSRSPCARITPAPNRWPSRAAHCDRMAGYVPIQSARHPGALRRRRTKLEAGAGVDGVHGAAICWGGSLAVRRTTARRLLCGVATKETPCGCRSRFVRVTRPPAGTDGW